MGFLEILTAQTFTCKTLIYFRRDITLTVPNLFSDLYAGCKSNRKYTHTTLGILLVNAPGGIGFTHSVEEDGTHNYETYCHHTKVTTAIPQ